MSVPLHNPCVWGTLPCQRSSSRWVLTSTTRGPGKEARPQPLPVQLSCHPRPEQPRREAPSGGGSFLPPTGARPLLRGPALLTQPCPSLGCPGPGEGTEQAGPNLGTCLTGGLWPGQTLPSVQPAASVCCACL